MTYPFGNINIGSYPDDGTGDPLRNAFNTINHNFANIANGNAQVYAPVQSVAGRIGNVVLSINDISGAASFAYVTAGVTSANAYTDSQIAIVNANVNALSANITANVTASVIANINLAGTNANIAAANVAIAQLQANDVTQNSSISSLNSSVVTVQNTTNANSSNITLLQSGATATNLAVSTLSANLGSFQTYANATFSTGGGSTYGNSNVSAYLTVNPPSGTYSNSNVASYLPISTVITGINGNITAINISIAATNSNVTRLQSNSVTQFTWLNNLTASTTNIQNNIVTLQNNQSADETNITLLQSASTGTNVAIITANTAMKSYVDANAVAQLSQISGANASIQTLSANVGSYYTWANTNLAGIYSNTNVAAYLSSNTDSTISRLNANTSQQQIQINSINSNVTAANSAISTLQASVGSISSSLVTFENTTNANSANITLLQSGATATNVAVATVTANVNSIYANVTTGPISVTANVTGGNVIATGYVYSHGSPIFGSGNIRFTGNNISSTSGNVTIINETVITGNLFLGNNITSIHNILGNVVFGPALDLLASADSIITVNPGTATPASSINTVHVQAIDGKNAVFGADTYINTATAGGSSFIGRRARGTAASPANVIVGDAITTFGGRGFGSTGFLLSTRISGMQIVADENFTDTAQGTRVVFNVTRTGSNAAVLGMYLNSTGNLLIPATTLSSNVATGALVVKGGAGIAGNVNVGGTIYGNVVANVLNTITTTVSSLPSASAVGAGTRAFVTDANTTTFNSAVSGSGGNAMPVFSTGTSWRIG